MGGMSQAERLKLAAKLFTPRQAIKAAKGLSGRNNEISKLADAIFSPGAHAIVFGDRGVGKTSLANCVADRIRGMREGGPLVLAPINCDSGDDYASLWKKVFSKITISTSEGTLNFIPEEEIHSRDATGLIGDKPGPHEIQTALSNLAGNRGIVVMIDEFDRLPKNGIARRLLADTIKSFSDQDILATVVVIGVAESVPELLHEHESITRHVVEVPVVRLSNEEQSEIINTRLPKIELGIDGETLRFFSFISKGLPYYVHLLGGKAATSAILDDKAVIMMNQANTALTLAIDESKQLLKDAYYNATRSPQATSKYPHTLTACALASTDELGYFRASDVAKPLSKIIGTTCKPGSFSNRIKKLASDERGNVLVSRGEKYDVRYRFVDPLMEPFVVMKGFTSGLVNMEMLFGKSSSK